MRRILPLLAASAGAALLAGCATTKGADTAMLPETAARTLARKDPNAPIWQTTATPRPLDPIRMDAGASRSTHLRHAASARIVQVRRAKLEKAMMLGSVDLSIDDERLVATSSRDAFGHAVIAVEVETADGVETLHIPIVVEQKPVVRFRYAPEAGAAPRSVVVAGTFNGWAQEANPLDKQADGSFAAEVALPPGTHTYKFVVDGNWIADPSNPQTDGGGFGNSLVEVRGTLEEPLSIAPLSADMPGMGAQGGFHVEIPGGGLLDAAATSVVLNNKLLDPKHYRIDEEAHTIRLAVPGSQWLGENFLTVLAQDKRGRTGLLTAQFAHADAPRSPRDEVIYFPFTDRFRDGDASLNNPSTNPEVHPLANYAGGDWKGIREKLEDGYFSRLGVTTLWLSPLVKNTPNAEAEFPPPHRLYTGYHGYWPIDSFETNEQFGSKEDLRALVQAAHAKGIAVLFDFVANHVHQDHPLFREDPTIATPRKLPDGRDNIRLFDEVRIGTWFDDFLPTLNYTEHPRLRKYMIDNALYWMRETGADGFRQDAVKHLPEVFWREFTDAMDREHGSRGRLVYQVGETISGRDIINLYVGPDLLHGQFDFPLYFTLRGVLAQGRGSMADLARELLASQRDYPAGSIMSPLIGNHDVSRFMAYADGSIPDGKDEREWGFSNPPVVENAESYAKLRLAFAFLMSLPGPPMVYYGDEIGMTGAGDPDNRRPMQWDGLAPEQTAIRDALAQLAHARHGSIALRRGHATVLHSSEERLVLLRTAPEETVLVALSRQPDTESLAIALPQWMGHPAALEPLAQGGINAFATDGRLRLDDGKKANVYGVWRVRY